MRKFLGNLKAFVPNNVFLALPLTNRSGLLGRYNHRRTSTFGSGGAVTLLPERKLHSARKHVLYRGTQVAVKTKTLPILTSNARIIIPKLQLNPNFSNLRGKRKFGYLEKSGVTKFRRRRGKRLLFRVSYQEVPKNEGSRVWYSTVVISVETSHTL